MEPSPTLIVRDLGEVDHRHLRQPLLQLAEARVDEALPFFGRVIFRVFAEVPVGPGLQDLLRQLDQVLVFEHSNFILKFFLNIGHRKGTAPKVTL